MFKAKILLALALTHFVVRCAAMTLIGWQ